MNNVTWQSLVLLALEKNALRRLTFSRPLGDAPAKVVCRLCKNGKKTVFAVEETLPLGKVAQKNCPAEGEAVSPLLDGYDGRYGQINLQTSAGDAEARRNKKGSSVLLGGDKLFRALCGKSFDDAVSETLFHEKNYILEGNEPFLVPLGIADASGRIHDKKQAKFRQINRFLEHIREILPDLPEQGDLLIYDLCCGKSYLSFAVYHYFTVVLGRRTEMLCMDLKADVMDECAAIARDLGYTGMHFVAGDVRRAPRDRVPHLALSLHACDVATDIVLHFASSLGAPVVLSTPCCHRDLAAHIASPELDFVTRYPFLRRKVSDALTDAARLARLRAHGYEVTAMELTDPDDTPKNTLLRARRVPMPEQALREAGEEYRAVLRFLLGRDAEDYPEGVD